MMKRITLLLLLSGAVCSPLCAQTSREALAAMPEATGGVYYAYPETPAPQTPAPKGYTAFYVSHYGRHGSRWLIADADYRAVIDRFEAAHEAGALTPLGEDVLRRLEIVWEDARGHGGDLTPKGVRQHRGIAERMFRDCPDAFRGDAALSARATIVGRCILSMDAFCERLKELNPQLRITRESCDRYMDYLNYHSPESQRFASHEGVWYEEYRKFAAEHTRPERLTAALFADAGYVRRHIHPEMLMEGLYWIASDMQNTDLDLSFYDLFTAEELFDLWQIRNYHNYVIDGPAPVAGGMMLDNARALLRNIVETADEAIAAGGGTATLRFGHDGNILPLTGLMRIENCYAEENDPEAVYRVWTNFSISPMAANLQLRFYRKAGSEDILVKILLNEREVKIPVESDLTPYYHWSDVREYYRTILGE